MPNAYNAAIRNARMTAVVTEAGSGAIVKPYTGARPAAGGAVTSQTLIGTLSIAGALGAVSGGVLTIGSVTGDASADASGTPTWLRVFKSDGTNWVADFDVPTFPLCTAGQPIDIVSWTVTEGNGA